jgi:UDP-N-acetyl-2-amino-2-deoxyglucuronate dehydrogenase
MQMKIFKILIFGTGRSAISHINCLKKNQLIKIVGVVGSNKRRLNLIKKKFNVNIFLNRKLIFKDKPDISLIANQNFKHYSDALLSLKNNCDVLVEKPLTTNPIKTLKLIEIAKKKRKKLAVVLQRRLDESSKYLSKLIKKNFFGKLIFINLNIFMSRRNRYFNKISWLKNKKKSGGGILLHHAIHSIDQLLFILNLKPIKVSAFISKKIMNMTIEDTAVAIIRFKKNILATVKATYCANPKIRNSIEFYGDKNSMIFANNEIRKIVNRKKKTYKKFLSTSEGSYEKIWNNFIFKKKNQFDADKYLETEILIKKMYAH